MSIDCMYDFIWDELENIHWHCDNIASKPEQEYSYGELKKLQNEIVTQIHRCNAIRTTLTEKQITEGNYPTEYLSNIETAAFSIKNTVEASILKIEVEYQRDIVLHIYAKKRNALCVEIDRKCDRLYEKAKRSNNSKLIQQFREFENQVIAIDKYLEVTTREKAINVFSKVRNGSQLRCTTRRIKHIINEALIQAAEIQNRFVAKIKVLFKNAKLFDTRNHFVFSKFKKCFIRKKSETIQICEIKKSKCVARIEKRMLCSQKMLIEFQKGHNWKFRKKKFEIIFFLKAKLKKKEK